MKDLTDFVASILKTGKIPKDSKEKLQITAFRTHMIKC